jgi:O-methyltransferase
MDVAIVTQQRKSAFITLIIILRSEETTGMKRVIKKILNKYNYDIVKVAGLQAQVIPGDFDDHHKKVLNKVGKFTMTSPFRIFSLVEAVKYVVKNKIEGSIVECGVWKGGSMMAVAETLKALDETTRHLYLYDTYEGMSEPTEYDKTYTGDDASKLLNDNTDREKNLVWAYSALDTVKENMQSTDYPAENITYIKGKVEDTIPQTMPSKIALLRLDTDWYESTKHELIHLYPLLQKGGVLILDDYGHWAGAKRAVDEYISQNALPILLNRIDETGRIAVKP